MPADRSPLLILGASARSAAFSALRAGFSPICADVYADEDLRAVATLLPLNVKEYPEDLVRCAALAPPAPWIYTGAVENYPDVVRAIAAERPLWGNSAESIWRVRDPAFVQGTLSAAGLPVPAIRSANDPPPPDGTWMIKPMKSGGGRGIHVWNEHHQHCATLKEPHWFQQRIEGESLAAIYIACEGEAVFVGATRQRVGSKSSHSPPHGYCGSLGPILFNARDRMTIARVGSVVSAAAELQGIFGIDGRWNREGFWPVDINPRYTASVEVLEHAYELPLISWHALACNPKTQQSVCEALEQSVPAAPKRYGAKAILFAKHAVVPPHLADLLPSGENSPFDPPLLADLPVPGIEIAAGHPICSVFGWGESEEESQGDLEKRLERVRGMVEPDTE